jgi:hypothetical protein
VLPITGPYPVAKPASDAMDWDAVQRRRGTSGTESRCPTRAAIAYLNRRASGEAACREAIGDLRSLKRSYLSLLAVHVINSEGDPFVASIGLEELELFPFRREDNDLCPGG